MRVGVLGTGLVGTSIGLALSARGLDVLLDDADPARARLAADRGAGRPWPAGVAAEHCVVAVPPGVVADAVYDAQQAGRAETYSDTASVKALVVAGARARGCDLSTFCPGHPVAGRERSGPAAGQADLFEGRAWVLTPLPSTAPAALAAARRVAETCGATAWVLSPQEHDDALGLVSHVPQLVASLLAARLVEASEPAVRLAGTGLRDTTRIAASDPALWAEIAVANASVLRPLLSAMGEDLARLVSALAEPATAGAAVADVVRRGRDGRARLPGKHGVRPTEYAAVAVILEDRPGGLGRIFSLAAGAEVNVEDVDIEHAVGQQRGVVQISVAPGDADRLVAVLSAAGFAAHPI